MILLTPEEIVDLHERLVAATGGSHGLRDQGLLESAVHSASASYGHEEVYPTVEEKAARLAYALVSNHAFIDGNKRIGIYVMLMTLSMAGISLRYEQAELIALGLGLADGSLKYEEALDWINRHTSKED